jgi:hypothetical protein
MADLKESIATKMQLRNAAAADDEAVRLDQMTTALAGKPSSVAVQAAIDAATHPAATAATSQSLVLTIPGNQIVSAEVKPVGDTVLQAAATGQQQEFVHPVVAGQVLTLSKVHVTSVIVTLRTSTGTLVSTGVLGTDYALDAILGKVTIQAGGNLLTSATQKVRVTYNCDLVNDGAGLLVTSGGLMVEWGNAHDQVPRGDHVHANDHPLASPDPATGSTIVTVNGLQKIRVEVKPKPGGAILATSAGVEVDFSAVAAFGHGHSIVTNSAPGFMSSAMLAALTSLGSFVPLSVDDTESVQLSISGPNTLTADVIVGAGLLIDPDDGVIVDFGMVATKSHDHPTVTGLSAINIVDAGSGYVTPPAVTIAGNGTGATATSELNVDGTLKAINITNRGVGYTTATATVTGNGILSVVLWNAPGFFHPLQLARIATLEAAVTSLGPRMTAAEAAIALRATTVYVDAADAALGILIAGKAPLNHNHVIADVTGLQTALDGKAALIHVHPDATETVSGFMSAEDKMKFDCLAHLLKERQEAETFLPDMRIESPALTPGVTACPGTIASDVTIAGGSASTVYTVKIHVRGKIETKDYTGGTSLGNVNTGGTPANTPHNVWKLLVSDPPQSYYLNRETVNPPPHLIVVDYEVSIQIRGQASVSLAMDSIDGLQLNTPSLVGPSGVSPYPAAFDGQFIQVEALQIVGFCILEDLFGGEDGSGNELPPVNGGVIPRPDPGNNLVIPPGVAYPPLDITRELSRVNLCDCGEADDTVNDILIDGETIWVGGKFRSWGNVDTWGLAKLDHYGHYDPFFLIGGGFSRGIEFIRKSGSGVVVAGKLDSLFQGNTPARPVWLVKTDGARDSSFTAPLVLNQFGNAVYGEDSVCGLAVLEGGKVVVLSPQALTVMNPDGSLFFQAQGTDRFNHILSVGDKLLLSSHAYTAAGVAQTYKGIAAPRGLKLLDFGGESELNIAVVADFGKATLTTAPVADTHSPYAHWKADALSQSNGSIVTSVPDSSGNSRTLTGLSSFEPTFATNIINGKPAFRFQDEREFRITTVAWFEALTAGEIFFVLKPDFETDPGNTSGTPSYPKGRFHALGGYKPGGLYPASDGHIYDMFGNSSYVDCGNPTLPVQAWRVFNSSMASNGDFTARFDTVTINTTSTGTPSFTNIDHIYPIGNAYQNGSWFGYIAEILIYNRVLTATERGDVEKYLSDKYALSLPSTGGSPLGPSKEVDVANMIKAMNPDAVLGLGDVNYPLGEALTIDANVGQFYNWAMSPYHGTYPYVQPGKNKLYVVPGEKDWGDVITATAVATVNIGQVQSVAVVNPGAGYSSAPTVVVTGDGTGAVVVANMTGSAPNMSIASFTVSNTGSAYSFANIAITGGGHVREASLAPYLDYFDMPGNERYYKVSVGQADCFMLDTDKNEPDGYSSTSKQMVWLKNALAESTAAWKFVFGHHGPKSSAAAAAWIDGDMKAWGADAYFNGHGHVHEHVSTSGFDWFTVGPGGESLGTFGSSVTGSVSGSRQNLQYGFTRIKVKLDTATIEFWKLLDTVPFYSYSITKTVTPRFGTVDPVWALNAGTGANSSCNAAVAGPANGYFIVGNSLLNYNSPDQSWNADQKGNLLLRSEQFEDALWIKVGSLTVTANFANSPTGTATADKVADTDGVALAYEYQDVAIVNNIRYVFSAYVKKDTDTTRYPLFRMEMTGGTAPSDVFAYLNTSTGIWALGGNLGTAQGSVIVEDAGLYWRISLSATNTVSHTSVRVYIYPAYSNAFASAAVTLTGFIVIWGAQLRQQDWQSDYVATGTSAVLPSGTGPNSDRFRGLYKILATGEADPTFAVNLTLSGPGHAIPFAIDALERVYFGGPVATINGTTVQPWKLYRVLRDGALDKTFPHFNDKVLVARLSGCGRLVVGGAFTAYGARRCGRFIMLNPDGTPVEEIQDSSPIIISDTEPDVVLNPCLADKVWVNRKLNPHGLYLWDRTLTKWISICQVCHVTLSDKAPAPVFDPPNGNAPLSITITCPGFPTAQIKYTIDGTTPSDTVGLIYTTPVPVNAGLTLKAIALVQGFDNSDVTSVTYQSAGTNKVESVTFNPPTGTNIPATVTLATPTAGAVIKYTLDGSDPSGGGGLTYSTPLVISTATTIRAYATKATYTAADITQATYVSAFVALMNVQFRDSGRLLKSGAAAIGSGPDVWNTLLHTESQKELIFSDSAASGVTIRRNPPATGAIFQTVAFDSRTDNLEKTVCAYVTGAATPDGTGAFYFDLLGLSPGRYDMYLYLRAELDGTYLRSSVKAARWNQSATVVTDFNPESAADTSVSNAPPWFINKHYVRFSGLQIVTQGEFFRFTPLGGKLSGLQIAFLQAYNPPQLPSVVAVPNTGAPPQTVALSVPGVAGAAIRYTTNNTIPTSGSTLYSAPLSITADPTTLRAFASKAGYKDSAISLFTYKSTPDLAAYGPKIVGLKNFEFSELTPGVFYFHFPPSILVQFDIQWTTPPPSGWVSSLITVTPTGQNLWTNHVDYSINNANGEAGLFLNQWIGTTIRYAANLTIQITKPGYAPATVTCQVQFDG